MKLGTKNRLAKSKGCADMNSGYEYAVDNLSAVVFLNNDIVLRSDSLKKLFGHHGSLTINLHMAKDAPLSTVTRSKTALDK